ncbi:hypothetical protein FRB91_003593 [Serendipita sp. 411]|nr:hypothetical protein FRB91_003593 [Serendipita sp. 411]
MSSYKEYEALPASDAHNRDEEAQTLLETSNSDSPRPRRVQCCQSDCRNIYQRFGNASSLMMLVVGFAGGIISTVIFRFFYPSPCMHTAHYPYNHPSFATPPQQKPLAMLSFPADIGATVTHEYPPLSPTNAIPEMFPTEIGYPGPTATGAEPGLVLTAGSHPSWKGTDGLVRPDIWNNEGSHVSENDGTKGEEDPSLEAL